MMGIKGLVKLIRENVEAVCTEQRCIRGELVVDGYGVLHALYEKSEYELYWDNGGCYAYQHRVTIDYFQALVNGGVKPIVVLDGGGCAVQHEDTVYRRSKEIAEVPRQIEDNYNHRETSHTLPVLSREVFVSSLREKNIDIYVADGKATKTAVMLANHYECPILTNSTNYCVSGVVGGVVLFEHFDTKTCRAPIYMQTKLVEFCQLCNPDLVYAIVAIMGDGSDTSIPFLYHGPIKRQIECNIIGIPLRGRSIFLNTADFIRIKKLASIDKFKQCVLMSLRRQDLIQTFSENCQKAVKYSTTSTLSSEELTAVTTIKCSKPCDLPGPVFRDYRSGTFPVLVINAMTIGKCVLEQSVGDQKQRPPPMLGKPVRQLMYGLAKNLMSKEGQSNIQEFYRNIEGALIYESHMVTPKCEHESLLLTNIYGLDADVRKPLAVRAICEVLECPEHILDGESVYAIVTLVTRYWAKHLIQVEPMPNTEQLIKALVINFFFNLSDPDVDRQPDIDKSKYSDPYWIKVYHALLEWQSLYRNVCSLNAMLNHPFKVMSPCFLYDGPLVFFLALYPSPQIIDTYISKLNSVDKAQYEKIFSLIMSCH